MIIGIGNFDITDKRIYEYEDGHVTVTVARNISPYLLEGSDIVVSNRSKPLCAVPEIGIGNKPIDGGYYLFTPEEKEQFLRREPAAAQYFQRWFGSNEFVNGIERWCLWLGDFGPSDFRRLPECKKLATLVSRYRRGEIPPKGKDPTQKNTDRNPQTVILAKVPTRFHVENMPKSSFLVIPETGSERRRYLPVGFMSPKDGLCSNLVKIMPDATLFHFGVLCSAMHMAWMRHVGGRMKSDPRYSVKLVYNNFPWPTPNAKHRSSVEEAGQHVLDVRKQFLGATLADLYDPVSMPANLVEAHAKLDRTVDLCYRPQPFQNDRQRIEHLFGLYEKLTSPLIPPDGKKRRRRNG